MKTVINDMVFDAATVDLMQMAVRDALISFMTAKPRRRTRPPFHGERPENRENVSPVDRETGGNIQLSELLS